MKKRERKYVQHLHHKDGRVFVIKMTAFALERNAIGTAMLCSNEHGNEMLDIMERNPNGFEEYTLVEILGEKI